VLRREHRITSHGIEGFGPYRSHEVAEIARQRGAVRAHPGVAQGIAQARAGLARHRLEERREPALAKHHPIRWHRYQGGHEGHAYRVIEAISEGVVFNSLDHAVGDYVAALRPNLSKVAKAQAVVAAFQFLDRPYDFNFDFATDHALVCTELIWRAYRPAEGKDGLLLPLVDLAGRQTLPANDIAKLYAKEHGSGHQQFEFVYFVDAVEKQREAVVSDEATFLDTHTRTKWDYRKQ